MEMNMASTINNGLYGDHYKANRLTKGQWS